MTTKGCFFRLTEQTREDLATLATRWNLDKTATLAKALQMLAEIPKTPKLSAYEASLPISLSARQSGKTATTAAMMKRLNDPDPTPKTAYEVASNIRAASPKRMTATKLERNQRAGFKKTATAMLKKLAKIDPSEIVGNFKTLRERAPIFKPSGKL